MAGGRHVASALAVSVLAVALLGGCRCRPRGMVHCRNAPACTHGHPPRGLTNQDAPDSKEGSERIRGRIVDEAGMPPAATVYVLRWKREPTKEDPMVDPLYTITSDASGGFSFDESSAASGELHVHIAGLSPRRLWLPVFEPRSPLLVLGTRTLRGVVRDPEGRAVAGALVKVFLRPATRVRGQEGTGHQIRIQTQRDGSYRFDRLPAGRCWLSVEGVTSEGESWFEEQWSFVGPRRITQVDLGSPNRQPVVTARVLAAPGGEPRKVTLLGFRPASGGVRWAAPNADGTHSVRLPPGSYAAVMSVAVEIDDDVFGEGEAPLLDAGGNPATVTIHADSGDPTLDLYLPGN